MIRYKEELINKFELEIKKLEREWQKLDNIHFNSSSYRVANQELMPEIANKQKVLQGIVNYLKG